MKSLYRSINRPAPLLQLAILGAPGTGKNQFLDRLRAALGTVGLTAEIAMPVALNVPFKADSIFLMGMQSTDPKDVAADGALRRLLARHKLPYQVLYGSPGEAVAQAMNIIRSRYQDAQDPGTQKTPSENRPEYVRSWVWACDKCSDPQCEHQLLTGLLAIRSAAVATGQLP